MYHGPGRPSPGPQWEALKDPTDSSGAEEEIDADASTIAAGGLGKRKEFGWLETGKPKRAKHYEGHVDKPGSSGSISRPGPLSRSSDKYTSNSNSNRARNSRQLYGPSTSNASTSSVSHPSMGPPPMPSRIVNSTEGESSSSTAKAGSTSRNDATSAAPSSLDEDFPSSLTNDMFNRSRDKSTGTISASTTKASIGKAPRLARKSTGKRPPKIHQSVKVDPEVIEISSDDSEDEPPPPRKAAPLNSNPPKPSQRAPGGLPPLPSTKSTPTSSSLVDASSRATISNRSSPESPSSRNTRVTKPDSKSSQASTSKGSKQSSTRQVAVKSSGKRRERRSSNDEESNSAASRTHSRVTSFSGADMRTLDEALGIGHLSNVQDSPVGSPSMVIKKQTASPQIPRTSKASLDKSGSSHRTARKPHDERQNLKTLGDAIVAAAKSNSRLDKRIGESLANAIDLTSDTEEIPALQTIPNKRHLVSKANNSAPTPEGKRSINKLDTTSSPSNAHPNQIPSSPVESSKEASPPPTSSSPPVFSPSDATGVSSNLSESENLRPGLPNRHSAPSASRAESNFATTNTRKTVFLRPAIRSISTGLLTHSTEKEASEDSGLPSSLPESHAGLSSASLHSPLPPNVAVSTAASIASLDTVSGDVTSHAIPDARSVRESSSDSNMVIVPPAETATYSNYSEEEAMQVMETIMDDASDDIPDPLLQSSSDDAGLSLEIDDRPPSRVSSYSSNSDGWALYDKGATRTPSSPASRSTTPEKPVVGFPITQKTYGGFAAITWKEYIRNPNNFALKPRYTKDLRPGLVDHVVEMSKIDDSLVTMQGMRDLYEAMILENTVDDEPEAPPIKIQNSVDDSAAPPWEFYYTNYMWHGEGVPAPDVKDLVGCSCKGVCNPKNKSCSCLKRQSAAYAAVYEHVEMDFVYDKNGKLKKPGFPIYECNALCGCGDECRNRVIQRGRNVHINLRKTQYKGWGVFAAKKITNGSFLGIYSGELISAQEAQRRGIAYNKFGRTYLFDLDFHHLRKDHDEDKWTSKFTVDAFKAGNFTRFLNHSCDPNTRLFPCYINEPEERPLLAVFATKDIEPNEEVCFSYSGQYPDDEESPKKTKADAIKLAAKANKKDKIYEECKCGAANCSGYMFLYDSDADDDDDDDDEN